MDNESSLKGVTPVMWQGVGNLLDGADLPVPIIAALHGLCDGSVMVLPVAAINPLLAALTDSYPAQAEVGVGSNLDSAIPKVGVQVSASGGQDGT